MTTSLSAELRGLTNAEVAERVAAGKTNDLPPRSGRTVGQIISANVFTRINAMLFTLFVIVMSTGNWLQAAFGLLIIANSGIGIVQELRAKRTLDRLVVLGEAHPRVLRDGELRKLDRNEVVLDDIIALHPGDQVVVDGEVVASDNLELDESMLTGESLPVPKPVGAEVRSGCYAQSGAGYYRATKVGADAYAAQITAEVSRFTLAHSELRAGIDQILRVVSFILVPVGLLTIWVQFTRPGMTWQESVLRMAAALVPMVPEGLVLLTTMAFAVGVVRLGRRNCLIQELPAIEALARVDVVCTDKTGTLTTPELHFGELISLRDDVDAATVLANLAAADPAPNASMRAIQERYPNPSQPWQIEDRTPFSSAKQYSAVTFAAQGRWLLGAPERLATGEVLRRADEISATGRRVLLLADETPAGEPQPAAMVVLDQAIRPDAADTLDFFADQDVAVKVLSGDDPASVAAVATRVGMGDVVAVNAGTLPDDDEQLQQQLNQASVIGRVTPEQKRRIVHALQHDGSHVAMLGDGVNDVLAIKAADLGVAMGSGSAASRNAAQVVLLDDQFSSLPPLLGEGRRVIGNIERVAKLFLTKTVYAATMALTVSLLGLPNPFLPLQLTIVGWFTIGIPAFLLSLAPNNDRARPGFVGRVLRLSVPSGLLVAAATVVTYVSIRGFGTANATLQAQAATASLAALLIAACWVLAIVARPLHTWRGGLVVFAYVFYVALFYWPTSQQLLGLDLSDQPAMLFGLAAGVIAAALAELVWQVQRRSVQPSTANR